MMAKPLSPRERPNDDLPATVDVIIPAYNERREALAATLSACLKQTHPIHRIYVVDDGSREPVELPDWAKTSSQLVLLCLPKNQGVAAARNAAIARSGSTFLACVNTEVLPDPDWLTTCFNYLVCHPQVGSCYTRTVPDRTDLLLTRWRMRFQEPKFGDESGPSAFAHGHAAFFRRSAVDAVGWYNERVGSVEDSDICERMWKVGWETHYIAQSRSISIQEDTLKLLAMKQLRDIRWLSPKSSLLRVYLEVTKWTIVRAGRNVVKARFSFLPVDVGLWAYALWIATAHTLRFASPLR
ncbi:MAG: glycosyltransferase family 2 protein [Acidobacteria bacterium]|nr:glycosyltransferase family 2 protein [Acidobacteriota bacterium]MBS1866150.1 glycosyltransferase family 2 protein [Acidobacteriota bacterium]